MATKGATRAAKEIFKIAYDGKNRIGEYMDEREYEAFARLIDRETGVPEMRDALQKCENTLMDSARWEDRHGQTMLAVRAALARAKQ